MSVELYFNGELKIETYTTGWCYRLFRTFQSGKNTTTKQCIANRRADDVLNVSKKHYSTDGAAHDNVKLFLKLFLLMSYFVYLLCVRNITAPRALRAAVARASSLASEPWSSRRPFLGVLRVFNVTPQGPNANGTRAVRSLAQARDTTIVT